MSTHSLHIIYFLLIFYWFFRFNLETWCEKFIFYVQIFTALNMPKYALLLIYIFPCTILSSYGKKRISFCSYTGKYRSEKVNISNFTILKLSFFQRLIVIELLVSEITEKKLSRLLLSKNFFLPAFSFYRQWVIAKAKTYRCYEKRLLIKFLQNLKRKTWQE